MQNSLERLFDGVISSLHHAVLPEIDDPYAQLQLLATLELLANLAGAVDWRDEPVEELFAAAGRVVATAHEAGMADHAEVVALVDLLDAGTGHTSGTDRSTQLAGHVAALDESLADAPASEAIDRVRDAIVTFARCEQEDAFEKMRTAHRRRRAAVESPTAG
ncbi:MAG: hypothetical protein ACOC9T_00655 [Myxococcota bacterium]